MASQINIYQEEIFNFLRTVTIKFDPFAYIMGQDYMREYGIDNPHGLWNPYYINLSGEYTANDVRMTVYSPEVETQVPFDKDLIATYPKTAALYRIPHQEYTTLEERYPQNRGLIKSIAYPVEDIEAALTAPNLSLLAYDETQLHENERESLLNCLRKFLEMVRIRWWIDEYVYENMYAITFWGLLWQHLPNLLLTQRFLNIKTPDVHPFHIWEYLKSKGLNDYRDVLSNNQSLWLYRNINYILKNKGKNSNLVILAENLLQEVFVSLLYKDMYQSASTMKEECRTTPQFRSFNILTDKEIKLESFNVLNDRLIETGIEYRDGADFVHDQEQILGEHNYNILPTKFLELRKEPLNTANEALIATFFLDTLMYRFSNNNLAFEVLLTDPNTQNKHKLFVGDVILLWYWCLHRSLGERPVKLPTSYNSHYAYTLYQPQLSEIRESIYYKSCEYRVKTLVDVEKLISSIGWHPRPFVRADEWTELLMQQLLTVLVNKQEREQSSKVLYHRALDSVLEDITIQRWVELPFGKVQTYDEWMYSQEICGTIIRSYEDMTENTLEYEKLAKKCFDALFPIDYSKYKNIVGTLRNIEAIYTSIRDLFIQLGSYNITYLENDREVHDYITISSQRTHHLGTDYDYRFFWNLITSGLYYNPHYLFNLPYSQLEFQGDVQLLEETLSSKYNYNVTMDFIHKDTMHVCRPMDVDTYAMRKLKTDITQRQKLNLNAGVGYLKEIHHAE